MGCLLYNPFNLINHTLLNKLGFYLPCLLPSQICCVLRWFRGAGSVNLSLLLSGSESLFNLGRVGCRRLSKVTENFAQRVLVPARNKEWVWSPEDDFSIFSYSEWHLSLSSTKLPDVFWSENSESLQVSRTLMNIFTNIERTLPGY